MKLHSHSSEGPPCRSMRSLLDRAADGRSRSLGTWYARLHAARCPNCGRYLDSLRQMIARLKSSPASEDAEALERLANRLTS
jgi:hypothetical protein